MKHLGDITKISGYTAPIVDCIIGGSPCQDLSIAGKRAGLDGERSGLYMEQIRIVKEMRLKDEHNGRTGVDVRPRYMVWENVPGAFSSNKGEDFRIVLEELAKIKDKDASIPMPDKGKWTTSGCIMGDGWSIAWRVQDAQFWGVPQRRRRIALVADFGGQSAPEILFVRKSVSGHSDESEPKRKETPSDASRGIGADDCIGVKCLTPWDTQTRRVYDANFVYPSLCSGENSGQNQQSILLKEDMSPVAYSVENHPNDSRVGINEDGIVQTLSGRMGTGGGNVPMVMQCYSKQRRAQSSTDFETWKESDTANTLNAFDIGDVRTTEAVVYAVDQGGGKSSANVFDGTAPTLTCTHGGEPAVVYALDRAPYNQGENAQFDFEVSDKGISSPLVAKGPSAVCYGIDQQGGKGCANYTEDVAPTILSDSHGTPHAVCYSTNHGSFHTQVEDGICATLQASDYKDPPTVCYTIDEESIPYTLKIRSGCEGGGKGALIQEDKSATLSTLQDQTLFQPVSTIRYPQEIHDFVAENNADAPHQQGLLQTADGIARTLAAGTHAAGSHLTKTIIRVGTRYIVRRLTPLECERLQGYPDGWTDIGDWTDSKGKVHKSSDASRYKALGNSIALPPWKWVLKRICACYERDATMASLFDGIGGFPYLWEQLNGKGTCLWASEIEEFPIAVTKARIG